MPTRANEPRRILIAALLTLAGCGDGGALPPPPDAAIDGGGACLVSSHCSNGLFCDGLERCAPGEPAADARGCAAGDAPCEGMACDEIRDRCVSLECARPDADGDGRDAIACGGDDCDDADANRFPGHLEACDPEGHDEDCDRSTYGYRDLDGDGSPDATCCNGDACGEDCDDMRAGVHPGLAEVCDGRDSDCDGAIDEGVVPRWWPDADGDGFGTDDPAATPMTACIRPSGYAETNDDCDDGVGSVHPSAFDACDTAEVDEDCNGTANDPPSGCACTDGETRSCGLAGVCEAGIMTCVRGRYTACSIAAAPVESACDGRDEDCDGVVDDGTSIRCFRDRDDDTYPDAPPVAVDVCANPGRVIVGGCPTGYTNRMPGPANDDCDDLEMNVYPRAIEICDGLDGDCDARIDEGVGGLCYRDADRDGYAPLGATSTPQPCGMPCPDGSTSRGTSGSGDIDCDDANAAVHPGAVEICNRRDDDCSLGGGVDVSEDFDDDGHASRTAACTSSGGGLPHDDCNDVSALVFPGQTIFFGTSGAGDPTGFDYDCDGIATRQYPSAGGCASAGSCVVVPGWDPGSGAIPACGTDGRFMTECSPGCFPGSSPPRRQACR